MGSSSRLGYGAKAIIAVAIAAIAVMAFSVTFYLHNSSAIVIPQTQTGNYTVDNSTGLELIAKTDSYTIQSGDNISISIKVLNTKGYLNPQKVSRTFPQLNGNYRFAVGPCSYLPYGIAISKGNYSGNNISLATPLILFEPTIIMCPMIPIVSQYQFLAHSSQAKMYNPNDQPSIIGIANFSDTLRFSGCWTGDLNDHNFHVFGPGAYTIIAADGWGQALLLHFTVT